MAKIGVCFSQISKILQAFFGAQSLRGGNKVQISII